MGAQGRIETVLRERHHLDHTTLQVDHAGEESVGDNGQEHCRDSHGPVHSSPPGDEGTAG